MQDNLRGGQQSDFKLQGTAFFLFYLMASPISLAMSIQFQAATWISMLGLIIAMRCRNDLWTSNKYMYFFLMIGICTAYFDLLTFPLVGLCVPLLYAVTTNRKIRIKQIISSIVMWIAGYLGMWGGKWVVATLFTGKNIISDAVQQAAFRLSDQDAAGNVIRLKEMFQHLKQYCFTRFDVLCCLIFLLLFCISIGRDVYQGKMKRNGKIIPVFGKYLIVTALPVLWFIVLKNHSYIHMFFTYRTLLIIFLAGMLCLADIRKVMSN